MSTPLERVKAILAQVADTPSADRPQKLGQLCGDDHDLRREVESLLAFDDEPLAIAVPHMSPTGSAIGAPRPTSVETLVPGLQIGPYVLDRRLGRGGMGEVWLATQEYPVRRSVAFKVVRLGMDTEDIIRRFELERQTLAGLEHPSIARVYDAGATSRGRPYFVMEYVPGLPLTRYADARGLDIKGRVALFIDVCDAIVYAHRRGVIHRDLKPANVLVVNQDGVAQVKVIDFGLARVIASDAVTTRLTIGAHPMGTPAYMSPEQSGYGSSDIDTRADVFSLGIMLFELLTGRLPSEFVATDSSSGPLDHLRDRTPFPLPSRVVGLGSDAVKTARQRGVSSRDLIGLLRHEYDWIVTRSIEKDREGRYGSVAELAADLRRKLSGLPVKAGPHSRRYRIMTFVRRNRNQVLAGVIAAVLVVVAAYSGISQYLTTRSERELRHATVVATIEAFDRAIGSIANQPGALDARLDLAEALSDMLQRSTASDDPRTRILIARVFRRHAQMLADTRYANTGDEKRGRDYVRRAIALLEPIYMSLPSAEVAGELARAHVTLSRLGIGPEAAFAHTRVATDLLQEYPPRDVDAVELADAMDELGFYHFQLGRPSAWDEFQAAALSIRENLLTQCPDDPRVVMSYSDHLLSQSYRLGFAPPAGEIIQTAIRLLDEIPMSPANRRKVMEYRAMARTVLAHVLGRQSDWPPALRYAEDARELMTELAADSTDVRTLALLAMSVHRVGELRVLSGTVDVGVQEHERAHQMFMEIRARDDAPGWIVWDAGFGSLYLARARLKQGNVEGAQAAYRDYLDQRSYLAANNHAIDLWQYSLEAADLFRRTGRGEEARSVLDHLRNLVTHLDTTLSRGDLDAIAGRAIALMHVVTADLDSPPVSLSQDGQDRYARAEQLARERLGIGHEVTQRIQANRRCWLDHPEHEHGRSMVADSMWAWFGDLRDRMLVRRPDWGDIPLPPAFDEGTELSSACIQTDEPGSP